MNNNIFIPNCISKLNTLRDIEFKKHDFIYDEKIIEKKTVNTNLVEFKNFQSNLKKKALIDKNKPGNIGKKEYSSNNSNIDILEDDIFNNNDIENNDNEVKLEIEILDRDKKIELINDFIQRKNIILDESEYKKIEDIVDNPEINIKKYLNISKMYQQVNKITFIKKLENGSYIVDLVETKPKKTKKYFNK
jgi:hypothetical protein